MSVNYHKYIRSDEWRAKADRLKEERGRKCQVCGKRDVQLDTHHNTYDRLGDELDNDLVILCHGCHEKFHDVMPDNEEVSTPPTPEVTWETARMAIIALKGEVDSETLHNKYGFGRDLDEREWEDRCGRLCNLIHFLPYWAMEEIAYLGDRKGILHVFWAGPLYGLGTAMEWEAAVEEVWQEVGCEPKDNVVYHDFYRNH